MLRSPSFIINTYKECLISFFFFFFKKNNFIMRFRQLFHLLHQKKNKVEEGDSPPKEAPPSSIASSSSISLEFEQSRDLLKLDFFHTDIVLHDLNFSFDLDHKPPPIPKSNSLRHKLSSYRLNRNKSIKRSRSSPHL